MKTTTKKKKTDKFWQKEIKKCKDDFVHFAETYCHVYTPKKSSRTNLKLVKLHEHQKDVVSKFDKQYTILKKPRQTGATTLEVLYALWRALFNQREAIFFISQSRSSAQHAAGKPMLDKVRITYNKLPEHIRGKFLTSNKAEMEFQSQSRIISRAATLNTPCGYTPTLLIFDEAAFFGRHKTGVDILQTLFYAAEPAINLGGQCIITSTKNSTHDFFWKTFSDAKIGANQFCALEWLFGGIVTIDHSNKEKEEFA